MRKCMYTLFAYIYVNKNCSFLTFLSFIMRKDFLVVFSRSNSCYMIWTHHYVHPQGVTAITNVTCWNCSTYFKFETHFRRWKKLYLF